MGGAREYQVNVDGWGNYLHQTVSTWGEPFMHVQGFVWKYTVTFKGNTY